MADEVIRQEVGVAELDAQYGEVAGRLVRYLRGVGYAEPADIAQEAVLRAIREGIQPSAWGWLKQVAKRIAIDEHRKRRSLPSGGMEDLEHGGGLFPSAEQTAIDRDGLRIIDAALKSLPARYREALLVSARNEGRSVASELELSGPAARSLLYRARARFRAELERLGYALVYMRDLFLPSRDHIVMMCVVACVSALPTNKAVAVDHRPAPPRPTPSIAPARAELPTSMAEVHAPPEVDAKALFNKPNHRPSPHDEIRRYETEFCTRGSDGSERRSVYVYFTEEERETVYYKAVEALPIPTEVHEELPVGTACPAADKKEV